MFESRFLSGAGAAAAGRQAPLWGQCLCALKGVLRLFLVLCDAGQVLTHQVLQVKVKISMKIQGWIFLSCTGNNIDFSP